MCMAPKLHRGWSARVGGKDCKLPPRIGMGQGLPMLLVFHWMIFASGMQEVFVR